MKNFESVLQKLTIFLLGLTTGALWMLFRFVVEGGQ